FGDVRSAHCKLFPAPMRCHSQLVIAGLLLCCSPLHSQDARKALDAKVHQQAPSRSQTDCYRAVEILSNTMGVDFRHYSEHIVQRVRQHWYKVMPEVARPPVSKKGVVALEFGIEKDGQVKGSKIVTS